MVLSAADQREGVEEGGWRMGPVSGGTRAITQEDGLEAWQPGRVGCGGRGEREREGLAQLSPDDGSVGRRAVVCGEGRRLATVE
jgi:hypothetical protein